jgi:hypothetical protein
MNKEFMKKDRILRRNVEIDQIFTIFVNISLNLLPFLSFDYPDNNKSHFYKLFCEWNHDKDRIKDYLITLFCESLDEMS